MTSMTARVAAVRIWLASQHMLADDEWLIGCVEYLCSGGNTYSQQEMNQLAREQWLLNDLKDVCPGCLPAGLSAREKTQLSDRYVLQVNCALDVGIPAYQQYQKLKKVNIENIEETTRHEQRIPNHRMMKLYLTDGVQELFGIEYRTMRNLTCDITPGCKILLKGPVECRRGMLLLQEINVEILGGEVEDLVTANRLPAVLSRLLGFQDVGRTQNTGLSPDTPAPPNAVPSNPTLYNNMAALQNTVNIQPNTNTVNIQPNTNTVNRQPNRTQICPESLPSLHHRPTIFTSFDRTSMASNIQPTATSRPVAVVTGVPVTDNFCDDDIDLDQIVAIEEQATKCNKRPLLSGNKTERRNSAEKRLKMLNSQEDNRADEFPSDADFLGEMDYNTDFNNTTSKPSYPINVPAEPFVYIKQIKEMNEIAREGKVFHVKVQILKLLSKLTIGKDGWSLKCTIIDGTGSLDVDFMNDVLTKLAGYSSNQMRKMIKEKANKPEVEEKALAALNAAKTKLQELNCILEITFIEGPKITELIPFTQRHAQVLKSRLAIINL